MSNCHMPKVALPEFCTIAMVRSYKQSMKHQVTLIKFTECFCCVVHPYNCKSVKFSIKVAETRQKLLQIHEVFNLVAT